MTDSGKCHRPDFLRPGDKVAMVSPSYRTPRENVTKTARLLRSWGLQPVEMPSDAAREGLYMGRYAGTPDERAAELRWALRSPDIKAILCNRGGYGALHLLGLIPPEEIVSSPKWLIGYSDISTLHALFNSAGVMSIHAPMSSSLADAGEGESALLLRDLLMGNLPSYSFGPHPLNRPGCAEGVLTGGNLCTITPLLGTEADTMSKDGIILFLEDVEESMHNIDRQLNILRLQGVLDRCMGVILGEFTGCDNEFGCTVEEMLFPYLEQYDIPLLCGFPAGHGEVNLPLVMGADARLEVREDGATLSFNS